VAWGCAVIHLEDVIAAAERLTGWPRQAWGRRGCRVSWAVVMVARARTLASYPELAAALGRPSHSSAITMHQRAQAALAGGGGWPPRTPDQLRRRWESFAAFVAALTGAVGPPPRRLTAPPRALTPPAGVAPEGVGPRSALAVLAAECRAWRRLFSGVTASEIPEMAVTDAAGVLDCGVVT